MSEITSYRDLVTWQKAMDLAVLVYVGYVQPADMAGFNQLATEVGELCHGLLRSLPARLQSNQAEKWRQTS